MVLLLGIMGLTGIFAPFDRAEASPYSFYQGTPQKEYETGPQLLIDYGFFHTKANYLSSGKEQSLEGGNYLTHQQALLGLRSVLFPNMGFSFLMAFHRVKKEVQGKVHQTPYHLTHLILNMDLLFYEHPQMDFILDVQMDYPFYKVRSHHSTVMAEGDHSFLGRLILQSFLWERALYYFHSGLQFRNGERSFLFVWRLGSSVTLSSPLGVGVELLGFRSVIQKDKLLTNPEAKKDLIDSANGGSQRFFYVDPHLSQYRAWVFLKSAVGELHLGGGHTLDGKRTAAGNEFFIKLIYNFSSIAIPQGTPKMKYKDLDKEEGYYQWFR